MHVRIDEILDSSDAIVPDARSARATVTFLGSVVGGELRSQVGQGSHENVPRWFSSKEVTTIETKSSAVVEQALRSRGIRITGGQVPLESLLSPKDIVEQGYDRILERFMESEADASPDQLRQESALLERLPAGARVLELGCGPGRPTTQRLAKQFDLTGVDISGHNLEMARRNCPGARFIHADMTKLKFPSASFDGVAAFYSIIHDSLVTRPV